MLCLDFSIALVTLLLNWFIRGVGVKEDTIFSAMVISGKIHPIKSVSQRIGSKIYPIGFESKSESEFESEKGKEFGPCCKRLFKCCGFLGFIVLVCLVWWYVVVKGHADHVFITYLDDSFHVPGVKAKQPSTINTIYVTLSLISTLFLYRCFRE